MDLLAIAVPFFLIALIIELFVDWRKGTGLYRSNDAINSLSVGILSSTFGYFTGFVALFVWGYVLQNWSLLDMPLSWFDASPRGFALWLIAMLAWDFCYYWNHRLGHEVSVLWAAHAVHHQSEDYNLSTALRQTSTSFLFGWVFYLPLFLLGFPMQVLLSVYALNLIYQFWVHTQMVGKLGVLDRILVTPSNHRVHHAQNAVYIDKNYGGILVIWDRLFGSFQEELDDVPVVFGVRKPLATWNPFWANLQVYHYLLFDARHAARWRDKLAVWFRRTGWRPDDVARAYPKVSRNLSGFQKYDPSITSARRRYVIAQFLVAVGLTLYADVVFAAGGMQAVVPLCVLLWTLSYSLGALNGDQSHAVRFEWIRLLIITPLAIIYLQSVGLIAELTLAGWSVIALYAAASLLWLQRATPAASVAQ